MKHPHYEVMMEWAADTSKVVQFYDRITKTWDDLNCTPSWNADAKYRIKPSPKPDVVKYASLGHQSEPVAVFKSDENCGHVELLAHRGEPLKDGDKLFSHPAPESELMVDMTPPATRRDRWMYEQGRLAERDPRSHPAPVQQEQVPKQLYDAACRRADSWERLAEAAYSAPVQAQSEPVGVVESAVTGAGGFHVRLTGTMPTVGAKLYAAPVQQEPVGYYSKTGHGTYYRETLSAELAELEHGGNKVWQPMYAEKQT